MFLFCKLYVAHLLGDFVFQFEELYRLKVRHVLGHFLHVIIHIGFSLLLVSPYLSHGFIWKFIGALGLVHLCQDLIKYQLQKRFPQATFFLFTLDQIIHALVIASILYFPLSRQKLGFPDLAFLNYGYFEESWTYFAIAFLLATFGCAYFLNAFRKSFTPASRKDYYITSFEMFHGIFERGSIVTFYFFTANPLMLLAVFLSGLLRIPFRPLRNFFDFISGAAIAALAGYAFRTLHLWI
ncbi:MAG: DUF3307 domain-containing protein [Candidatus Omnitrophica bacterium]|nr:DUF3307 domain-containing protein [Candidatus Omnitrophota bacterium]